MRSASYLVILLVLGGCASFPQPSELSNTVAALPPGGPAGPDGRPRFREIFCSLAASADQAEWKETSCDALLWRLQDEATSSGATLTLPKLAIDLRIFVVSGAFGDCRLEDMFPYGDEIQRLASEGVKIDAIKVSGRSSAQHNAGQIAEAIRAAGVGDAERIVLVGYSKGAVDILQFLVDEPVLARRVAAVVSVAGPIGGSPLAAKADWWYRELFAQAFSGFCDPGDGGVIASLLPETRRQWLADHPLPPHATYLSIAAFTTREHLSHGLTVPWRMLADDDKRNDGQVLVADAVIPGSTMLGYANADHWDVAIGLDKQLPYLSARQSPRQFPRDALFDAMLLFVSETLDSEPRLSH